MSFSVNINKFRYQTLYRLCQDNIIIEDYHWHRIIPNLHHLLYRIYSVFPFSHQTTLCFANDQRIKKLNYKFRNKNKATNVLTFEHADSQIFSGDIILALETIKREAQQQKKSIHHHVTHLIIHGLLHLKGYDHIKCWEAKEMEMQESVLLHQIGVPNPWKHQSLGSI